MYIYNVWEDLYPEVHVPIHACTIWALQLPVSYRKGTAAIKPMGSDMPATINCICRHVHVHVCSIIK